VSKTLIYDQENNVKLIYGYYTELTEYTNGKYGNVLVGEMTLKNVNTFNFVDDNEIRMSVGWRSKEKDAYDVTSFTIVYNKDNEKVKFTAIDGEAFGSQSGYYNSVWKHDPDGD
jgi:hypothetical protein